MICSLFAHFNYLSYLCAKCVVLHLPIDKLLTKTTKIAMKSRLNYLALVLLLAVAVILPARADSYKGTMTCLGTKMEYHIPRYGF